MSTKHRDADGEAVEPGFGSIPDALDEAGPGHSEDEFWHGVLVGQGVPEAVIERARAEGPLRLFALERYILDELPTLDIDEAAEASAIPADRLRAFWQAFGFPSPQPGEPTFGRRDLDMVASVLQSIDEGTLDETVALQMARVTGSSLARIAAAQIEASEVRQGGLGGRAQPPLSEEEEAQEIQRSAELIPMFSALMESVWRRHLAVAARRRVLLGDDEREREVAVGFADLEGFTSLSQQLPEHELAEVVNRFEHVAYEVVSRAHGRVVKMIGDEVMFMADGVESGAELALALAEAYAEDEALADVRVGLAVGQVLKFEGDLYGPAVNLASRIVGVAYPGTVVVPDSVKEALADHPEYRFRRLGGHYLRHIGRVRLWALRRAGDGEAGGTLSRAREHRATRRDWIAERMAERVAGLTSEPADR